MTLILWYTLKGQRITLLLLSLGLLGFAVLIASSYDTLGDDPGSFFESLPQGFRALLKAQVGLAATPTGYLAIGYRHPVYLTILVAFTIAAASGAMAREIERGTVFLLLARPLQRYGLVLAKLAALLLALILFLSFALLGTWIGVRANDLENVDLSYMLLVQLNALFLVLAVGGYSFLISSLSNEGGRTISLATGVTVLLFFVDYIATLWSAIDFLGPISLFYYYDPVSVVDEGAISFLHLGVLGGVAVLGFTGALIAFQRRDIAG